MSAPHRLRKEIPIKALRFLFWPDRDGTDNIVACCLDIGIITSGTTLAEAEVNLRHVVFTMIEHCFKTEYFLGLCLQAEPKHWDAFHAELPYRLKKEMITHRFGDDIPFENKTAKIQLYSIALDE